MPRPDKDRVARELVEWHYKVEPDLEVVYRVLADNEDDPSEPIKLLEITAAAVGTGRFQAFTFAPTPDVPYPTSIAELTREQLTDLINKGEIPPGWDIAKAIEIPRPRAA